MHLNLNSSPEVHGHRGCRGLRPENTLPAFLHALTLGVDVLELDVVISADRQVVISHEPWLNPQICLGPSAQLLDPTTAATKFNLYQLPYAVIQRCDCGQLGHPRFPEQLAQPAQKPLLREAIAVVEQAADKLGRQAIRYSVEIKSSPVGDGIFHPTPADFVRLVVEELLAGGVASRTTLMSFDSRILEAVHRIYPSILTCLLLEADQHWNTRLQELSFTPTTLGPDFTAVSSVTIQDWRTLYPSMRLVPWTVNDPSDMHRLMALGVDGITTDYPDRLLLL